MQIVNNFALEPYSKLCSFHNLFVNRNVCQIYMRFEETNCAWNNWFTEVQLRWLRNDIPDGNTPLTVFPCQPNLPPYSRPDLIKLLTRLKTEICGWRAFHTARTAKHFRKFVRTGTHRPRKKYSSFPLKNIKILIPIPLSFSARASFFNLQKH